MGMWQEFKEFAVKGNAIDLAVGIIIGAAFTGVINSLVNDIIMPPIGMLLGGADFSDLFISLSGVPYDSLAEAQAAGAATLNYGVFINTIINFLIVAFAVFLLIKQINRLRRKEAPPAPTTKDCPYCKEPIPLAATRCPQCTSHLEGSPSGSVPPT